MLLAVLSLWLGEAAASCPARANDVRVEVDAGIDAYESWSWEAFRERWRAADREVRCLEEILPRRDAANLHLLHAMRAALDKDATGATRAFRGVLAADPGFSPTADVAASGSLLRDAFDRARDAGPGGSREMRPGNWFVDGRPGTLSVPTDRAALVQEMVGGAEVRTWYLDGNGVPEFLLPAEPAVEADPEPRATAPRATAPRRHRSRGFAIAGGVAGLAGGGAFAVAATSHRSFQSAVDQGEAERLERANHLSAIGGGALGVVAVGLLAGALVMGEW